MSYRHSPMGVTSSLLLAYVIYVSIARWSYSSKSKANARAPNLRMERVGSEAGSGERKEVCAGIHH
ncbi:hypothetical protein J31TS4_02710 [Paenibacillus sp. J31TS4]|nr:hypothetical protein J31TS4_02710 [Paenibacillus sp. J31TS4]